LASVLAHAEEAASRIDMTTRLENHRREAVAMYDLARLAGIGATPRVICRRCAPIADARSRLRCHLTVDAGGAATRRTAHGYGEVLSVTSTARSDDMVGNVPEQQARLINDATTGVWRGFRASSLILAPIVVAGESAGLLLLGRRDGRYTRFDFSLATTMSDILSSLVRREIAAQLAERAATERRQIVEQMQSEFAEEMGRVIYVLDACQRLLGRDHMLPSDLARAARDARSALGRLGIPLAAPDGRGEIALPEPASD
jgi:hypothetical protein